MGFLVSNNRHFACLKWPVSHGIEFNSHWRRVMTRFLAVKPVHRVASSELNRGRLSELPAKVADHELEFVQFSGGRAVRPAVVAQGVIVERHHHFVQGCVKRLDGHPRSRPESPPPVC